jgi:integrase
MTTNLKVSYFIKKPSKNSDKGRKTYGLVKLELIDRKTKNYLPLTETEQEIIDSINGLFLAKAIDYIEAEVKLKDWIKEQYLKSDIPHVVIKNSTLSKVNQKIFNDFWTKVYSTKKLSDKSSAKYDYLRALKVIEPLAVDTASVGDIQGKIESNTKNNAQARRVTDRINEMFRFLGRKERLNKDKEQLKTIKHLTLSEVERVINAQPDAILKALIATLFATGCRLGESMAMAESDYSKAQGTIYIGKQLTRKTVLKLPKRERVGTVSIISKFTPYVEQWLKVDDKIKYRDRVYDELRRISHVLFKKADKHIGPHDLRHSHAIYLLGKGASLQMIALNLRNRIEVCQKYYTGYSHTSDTLEMLKKITGS